ncbi:MAG: hypothetical protein MK078_09220 [Crocinitomicaceae bacterium]|nr:hypothetical protein [Crocinitomicaceae bacterium]
MDSKLVKEAFEIESKSGELLDEAMTIIHGDSNDINGLKRDMHDKLLSINTIERICLKYRLRILDISYFKGELPQEAIDKVQEIESKYKTTLKPLKIIAPGRLFELEDSEIDPILLAEIEENKFLFIHKWGNEFNFFRKVSSLPVRSPKAMAISLGFVALTFSMLIALATYDIQGLKPIEFIFGTAIIFVGVVGFMVFICLAFNFFPTSMIWRSRYLDR